MNCQHRFTTYERIEFVPVTVIKRDGKRESFDKSKLLRGIVRACEKTGVGAGAIEGIVDEIESELQGRSLREVTSADIGELVLKQLPSLSEVAYIRFASVYCQFGGISDFVETLSHLQDNQVPKEESATAPAIATPAPLPPVSAIARETPASCASPS